MHWRICYASPRHLDRGPTRVAPACAREKRKRKVKVRQRGQRRATQSCAKVRFTVHNLPTSIARSRILDDIFLVVVASSSACASSTLFFPPRSSRAPPVASSSFASSALTLYTRCARARGGHSFIISGRRYWQPRYTRKTDDAHYIDGARFAYAPRFELCHQRGGSAHRPNRARLRRGEQRCAGWRVHGIHQMTVQSCDVFVPFARRPRRRGCGVLIAAAAPRIAACVQATQQHNNTTQKHRQTSMRVHH